MSSGVKPIQNYPVHGLMPKQDTQAASFIKKYPEYDGRGTVIAILDTGVDPGAAGMQVTTDGKPKIIDIVDCTGGGDVETTTVVKPTEEERNGEKVSVIKGLSGRSLIIDPSWKCPSGEYRVGIKRAYELFPSELKSRLKSARRENFERKHSQLLSEAQEKVASFKKAHPSIGDEKLKNELADLEARVDSLKELMKNYEDPGIILDCVVFHDGKDWRAVIDINESGDLRGLPCMTDYRKELQYHTFGEADLLNFCVNIYHDGDLLSIVTLSGSHGTHVAGITAANFPDEPELNGVAPGAQIVSLRIGDARLGSMETGPGLTRAATHLAINKVDLANMSYGESSSLPSEGYFIRLLAEEAINKSGCIFVTSAGNDGPCYSSIGAPAGLSASFITVGAYVKHAQMQAEYALLEYVNERPYTWSSRGPSTDGYHGVDVYAPGSAITSVPMYVLNKLDLKNGTSMSSPNACGCVALLLSALKAEKKHYTPYRVKTAVIQSSKSVDDPLNVGFIQVEKAWEYLEAHEKRSDLDILFEVEVMNKGSKRGIYLREHEESTQPQYLTVKIHPTFMGEQDKENPKYNRAKFDFEARVALISNYSWISAPDFVYLHSGGNAFQVKVDPTALSTNQFHYGEILGYDTAAPDRGPLFRIPVSVVKPIVPQNGSLTIRNKEFEPGEIMREFVHVPEGTSFVKLELRSKAPVDTSPARFMLHLLQILPQRSQKHKQTYTFLLGSGSYGSSTSDDQVVNVCFAVRGGFNLEIALAQFWSGLGKHAVDINVEFHGVQLAGNFASSQGVVHLDPEVTRLDIAAPVRREEKVETSVSFNKLRKYLRPAESIIAPLYRDRDTLPDGKLLYSLVLSYNFKVQANSSVTPNFPCVMNQLYEHFLAGVFGIVYDANKKVMGYFDVFEHTIKLEKKGDYTLKLQLMTEDEGVLEKLKNSVCELDFNVKSVNFNVFRKMKDVFEKDKSNATKLTLEKRESKALFISVPLSDQQWIPKEAKPGDALVGNLNFTSSKVDGGQYTALYVIPPEVKSSSNGNDSKEKENDKEKLKAQMSESLKELQISYLSKFEQESAAYKALLAQLESQNADDIALLQYKINAQWKAAGGRSDCLAVSGKLKQEQATEIVCLCDKILSQIDQDKLHKFYGQYQGKDESEDIKEQRKENDKLKQKLVDALKNKVAALGSVDSSQANADFEKAYQQLKEWIGEEGANELDACLIKVKRERKAGRVGSALKILQKYIQETSISNETSADLKIAWTVRRDLLQELGWPLWSTYDEKWQLIRVPPGGFAPF